MARPKRMHFFEGWALLGTLTLVITLMAAAIWLLQGADVAAVRAVIRATARTSLALFLTAFLASAMHQLWPGDFTKWMRRNRRQIGLAFAYSHFVHAVFITAFWQLDPQSFLVGRTTGSYIPGGLGYLAIIAMAATSFDITARAVGPRAWKVIHTAGLWYLFFQFAVSFGKRVETMPVYSGFMLLLGVALGVRLWAKLEKRRGLRKLSSLTA